VMMERPETGERSETGPAQPASSPASSPITSPFLQRGLAMVPRS
jgi:hypothetical protein